MPRRPVGRPRSPVTGHRSNEPTISVAEPNGDPTVKGGIAHSQQTPAGGLMSAYPVHQAADISTAAQSSSRSENEIRRFLGSVRGAM